METKAWYLSKGVWGGIIPVAAVLINMFMGEGTVTEGDLTAIATSAAAAIGGVLAIYGRIKATTEIG